MAFSRRYHLAYEAFCHQQRQQNQWRFLKGKNLSQRLAQAESNVDEPKILGFSQDSTDLRHDFTHNDYLGLSRHPNVLKSANDYGKHFGCGSRSSRLLRDNDLYAPLEAAIAQGKGMEKALIFPSGYQANLCTIATLLNPIILGDRPIVLVDELIHRSLIDGLRLSGARIQRFKHQDLSSLRALLNQYQGPNHMIAIVVESIYSMDGDVTDLAALTQLAMIYSAMVIVDDAHGTGLFGEQGYGLAHNTPDRPIDIILGTFSKALGSQGGFVCCSNLIHQVLINSAGGFIYSTGLSPLLIGAAYGGWDLLPHLKKERQQVHALASYARQKMQAIGLTTLHSATPIIPVIVKNNVTALRWQEKLVSAGFLVSAIRSPTVPVNTARLRINITAYHDRAAIDGLLNALEAAQDAMELTQV